MASNITLGIMEVQHEHSGDESDDDVDDVVEQSPCGRWEKRRQEVYSFSLKVDIKLSASVRIHNEA